MHVRIREQVRKKEMSLLQFVTDWKRQVILQLISRELFRYNLEEKVPYFLVGFQEENTCKRQSNNFVQNIT